MRTNAIKIAWATSLKMNKKPKTKFPRFRVYNPAAELGRHNKWNIYGDCAIRGICAITGEAYLNVFYYFVTREPLMIFGATGVGDGFVKAYMKHRGYTFVNCSKRPLKFSSRKLPKRCLVWLSDHITAIIDGEIYDLKHNNQVHKRKILGYFYKAEKKRKRKPGKKAVMY